MSRATLAPVANSAALAAAAICLGTTAHAARPGDQVVVKDLIAAKGWTSIVPMELNGDGLTDMLSYNAKTGRAIYSVASGTPGTQTIVRYLVAAKGWTAVVPMILSGSGPQTGLLSYNAETGRAVYSAAVSGRPGEQTILRDIIVARGWTSIVPMDLNGDGLTDLLFNNKSTRPGRLLGRQRHRRRLTTVTDDQAAQVAGTADRADGDLNDDKLRRHALVQRRDRPGDLLGQRQPAGQPDHRHDLVAHPKAGPRSSP
jgi:hypothetical protein